MNNTTTLKHITCVLMIAFVTLSVPTTLCHASVEPELTTAIRQKSVPSVQQLLASGVNINERDEGAEQTPLMWAVQVKDVGLVQILLAHGAAVNAQDDFGKTALMFAVEKDDAEIVKLLLHKGANASLRDADTETAADLAHLHGYVSIVCLLVRSPQGAAQIFRKSARDRVVALK